MPFTDLRCTYMFCIHMPWMLFYARGFHGDCSMCISASLSQCWQNDVSTRSNDAEMQRRSRVQYPMRATDVSCLVIRSIELQYIVGIL